MPLTREQKKWAVARRAQLALKHAFERIDWTEDVIKPELEDLAAGKKRLNSSGDGLEDAKKALGKP